MRRLNILLFIILVGIGVQALHAQSWDMPGDAQRCPSKWGADDQRGAANLITPDTVLRAAKLMRTGEVFELGHLLTSTMPTVGDRGSDLFTRVSPPAQPGARRTYDEVVVGEIGQEGTHLDGLTHVDWGGSLYNCVKREDILSKRGFTKLGIENVSAIVTRGVLVDVAALKGVPMLPDTYAITLDDVQKALDREKITLQPGDAVIINTGWGNLWEKDNARYNKSCPGLGAAAAEWIAKQNPVLIGADNWPVDVMPPEGKFSQPLHEMLLVVNGIYILENLKLDSLAAAHAYEFAFILEPLKMKGATGSTVAPIAIR